MNIRKNNNHLTNEERLKVYNCYILYGNIEYVRRNALPNCKISHKAVRLTCCSYSHDNANPANKMRQNIM